MELTKAVYTDILYTKADGIATITINRPKAYNAFTANTCEEMIHAFKDADFDRGIGVVVLTGAGEKAFCTGGDQGTQDGGYGGRGVIGLPIEELQSAIRDCNKPVIARVNGFAIGEHARVCPTPAAVMAVSPTKYPIDLLLIVL